MRNRLGWARDCILFAFLHTLPCCKKKPNKNPKKTNNQTKTSYDASEAAETWAFGWDSGEDGADALSIFGPQEFALPYLGGGGWDCGNSHRSAATLDLLAPVAPLTNVPLQLLRSTTIFSIHSLSFFRFFVLFCFKLPLARAWLFLLRDLTVTEIAARGAVLLHQASLAVTIAPASPGRTDK